MALKKIRILQVGDLHLPLVIGERKNLDDKDPTFSVELKNRMSQAPTKIVYQKLFKLLTTKSFDAILMMGDLSDKGNLENFNQAASYIAKSLQIGSGRKNADVLVGIVAGNHDINRELAKKPSIVEKFHPLNERLIELDLPPVPVDKNHVITLSNDEANAKVTMLNSCWGCGVTENIPELFREALSAAIDGLMGDENSSEFAEYYNRQLDTPAFAIDSIDEIVQSRSETPDDTVEIYVAHHNLLPQRTPRLAPYTELVNSGAMRAVLTDGAKPTIYLHGHIHEDPVEIIGVPGGASLISVSAPLSSEGFNEVEVVFTATGLPLSCLVKPWRFNEAGVLQQFKTKVISLLSGRRRSRDASLPKLLSYILDKREVYWSDLSRHDPPFYEMQTDEILEEGLEMLLADQTIKVENYAMSTKNWIVRSNL